MNEQDQLAAATDRQKSRYDSHHAYIDEYGDDTPQLTCVNLSATDGHYYDYPHLSVSSYRDGNGQIWCYLSSSYEYLIETGLNPATSVALPPAFIAELERKVAIMNSVGLDPKSPTTYRQLLGRLSEADTLDDITSRSQVDILVRELERRGLLTGADLRRLSAAQLDAAVKESGYNGSLSRLTREHALITTAYIANYYNSSNRDRADMLMEKLEGYATLVAEEPRTVLPVGSLAVLAR